jgi:hypothetical protein
MIRLFAGYDPREAVGYHVFCQSLIERTSEPVAITPLYGTQRDGTNAFTYQRFLVPYFTKVHRQGNILGCQRYADAGQH